MELKEDVSDIECERCHRPTTDVVNTNEIDDNTTMIDLKCRNCGYKFSRITRKLNTNYSSKFMSI